MKRLRTLVSNCWALTVRHAGVLLLLNGLVFASYGFVFIPHFPAALIVLPFAMHIVFTVAWSQNRRAAARESRSKPE